MAIQCHSKMFFIDNSCDRQIIDWQWQKSPSFVPQGLAFPIRKLMDTLPRKYVTQCSVVQILVSVNIWKWAFQNCVEIMGHLDKNRKKALQTTSLYRSLNRNTEGRSRFGEQLSDERCRLDAARINSSQIRLILRLFVHSGLTSAYNRN